jgi:hypothetical protein
VQSLLPQALLRFCILSTAALPTHKKNSQDGCEFFYSSIFVFLRAESSSRAPVSVCVVPCPFTFGALTPVFDGSFFRFATCFTSAINVPFRACFYSFRKIDHHPYEKKDAR